MSLQGLVETIVAFVRDHESWAIPIVFLVSFGESFCFFSVIWPGTAILVGIAALIAASGIDHAILWPMIAAAALGGTFGYALSYWIGRYFEKSIPGVWPFTRYPGMIPQGERFFHEYGAWGVFFGHFFGPVRAVIPVVAGMFRMPQIPFQIANFVSAVIWAAGVIAPSFFFVTFKDEILAFVTAHSWIMLGLLAILAGVNSIPTRHYAFSSLILFVAVGALLLYAGGDPMQAVAAGAIGAWVGDLAGYRLGARHRSDFEAAWASGWGREAGARARTMLGKWGAVALIPSKFHTTLRGYAPMAAGAGETSLIAFILASAVSAVIWAVVLLAPFPLIRHLLGW
jgi:membrane protein DedA with SNARE-associated domain